MEKILLAEGGAATLGNISVWGVFEKVRANMKDGDHGRLIFEVDEPEIEFPTGDGWGEPYTDSGGRRCVQYCLKITDAAVAVPMVVCAQKPDGTRLLYDITSGHWLKSLAELAKACDWALRHGKWFKAGNANLEGEA